MYDTKGSQIDSSQVASAATKLANVLAATIAPDKGYALTVRPITLDGVNAAEYLALEPWLWADDVDPLAE
jgi:hypothetical protein